MRCEAASCLAAHGDPAKKGRRRRPVARLARRVALFGQRPAQLVAGEEHVVSLAFVDGALAVQAVAGALQELRERGGFVVRQFEVNRDRFHGLPPGSPGPRCERRWPFPRSAESQPGQGRAARAGRSPNP